MNKNQKIKESLMKTKVRRESQTCKVFELKIQSNKLNKKQKYFLNKVFLEAKWFYNDILSFGDFANYDTKKKTVIVLNRERKEEFKELKVLGSQIKQELLQRIWNSIKALSVRKQNSKVGKLKYKGQISSIPLIQYGNTYKVINNRLKIQKCKPLFYVKGLEQIPKNTEFANANLIKKPSGYYLKVTCFLDKEKPNNSKEIVGIDFGIKDDLTLSNGIKFQTKFPITSRIKKEQRKLSKKKKDSNNYRKQKSKVALVYEILTNKKKDAKNKIVSYLKNNYSHIAIQDENIKGWQSGLFGRQVQQSIMGGIISELKKLPQTSIVNRYFPSTKLCNNCGLLNKISLSDRVYNCRCGYSKDRDTHSAYNILLESLPMEHRKFTPVEFNTSALGSLRLPSASMNVESGKYNSLMLC